MEFTSLDSSRPQAPMWLTSPRQSVNQMWVNLLSGAQTAVFDQWSDRHCPTKAPAGGSDRHVRSVPGTGCTGPAGPVGQICPTSWLLLWSDSVRLTTGQTRLFEHCSSSRV
ncbi:hypothetical protein PCASD_21522 [Puccinia coronata f. sp. avenae]|uniref:Uncharacterized protein n=1 Tax=Puccinia coronata f. sp. avenae TaxID=200324 RepID=A0A2N5SPB8_9BASI|nr:hypothetical protein PCASD_21522 [Puccinia coronata f. sp. avenae]